MYSHAKEKELEGRDDQLKRTYKTLDEIGKEKSLTTEERDWLEKMVSMCVTLRKHHRLNERLTRNSN